MLFTYAAGKLLTVFDTYILMLTSFISYRDLQDTRILNRVSCVCRAVSSVFVNVLMLQLVLILRLHDHVSICL